MKFLTLLSIVSIALAATSCGPKPQTADDKFVALADSFLEEYLQVHPETATYLGDHRFDARMDNYSKSGIQDAVDLAKRYLDSLQSIKVEDLNNDNRVDYDILMHNLNYEAFTYEELKPQENNPMMYNVGNAIYGLIARDFAPLSERMQSVKGRLLEVPNVLEQAKLNLVNPAAIHTETALQQNSGTIALLKGGLQPFIDSLPEAEQTEIIEARDAAVAAVEEYGTWLKEYLLPKSEGDFRLGEELYRKKLTYVTDSELSKEDILATAEADLEQTTAAMFETAKELYPKYAGKELPVGDNPRIMKKVIKTVLDGIANEHPTNESIVPLSKQILSECVDFVREHDIVSIPDEPVEIIVMPEFQRGVAIAYCDSPGALEKGGKTFFAISPTPADWPEERVESFFREYNNHMLRDLSVHEAVPGHYLQLVSGNKFKAATVLRGVFPSGIFAEGWATYTEQVMVDHGFGGPELKMQQLKMRLRLLINAIIDQKVHTAGLTETEALDLMMNKGFQEEGEATGKWRRACLTSGQLSTYYVGNMMINDIRERYEEKMGKKFNMKEFHDELISYGTISPKYFSAIMKLPVKEKLEIVEEI
jgi:uncharacterized protein (DUF885 family)